MSGVGTRDDDRTRSANVEPMNNSRPLGARNRSQIAETIQQRIHERPVTVPGARVNDHVRRLVNDDHTVVFIQNVEWDIFGGCGERRSGNDFNLRTFTFDDLVGRTRRASGDEDVALGD
jgi:hypothetical protein